MPEPALEPVPSRKQYFDSLESYLAYCEQPSDMPASLTKSRHNGRQEFMGTVTFAEAIDLARHGWTEGATMAKEYSAELHSKLDHPEAIEEWKRTINGGGSIDMAAFNQGRPDCFLNFEQGEDAERFISIHYNARLSGAVDTAACVRRGVMVAALIDALESNGYRTRFTFAFANSAIASNYTVEVYVTVKDYSESLDLDKIVFLTAHPAAHRRINWSFKELLPDMERRHLDVGDGYGGPARLTDPADLSFNECNNFHTTDDAAAYIRELLTKYEVTI